MQEYQSLQCVSRRWRRQSLGSSAPGGPAPAQLPSLKYLKVPRSIPKYLKVPRNTKKYPKVLQSFEEGQYQGWGKKGFKMGGSSKNCFNSILLATSLLLATCNCFRTVKLGGKDCTFKGEKVCPNFPHQPHLTCAGVQRGCGEGDWEIFGEGLHWWKGEAEAKKAGQIFPLQDLIVNFVSQRK